jgi:isoaspartyl peptidase/L-asparaginase-like protein (Ntn-hydrolase superfamily)
MRRALTVAAGVALSPAATAAAICTSAVECMESDGVTNAGAGAQLTAAGHVELDACLVACDVDWRCSRTAAVAAVPGVRNASRLAHVLFEQAHGGTALSLGRVRPTMLCGEQARVWAVRQCPQAVAAQPEALISPARREQWNECRRALARVDPDAADWSDPAAVYRAERGGGARSVVGDTVGAVCWLQSVDGRCSVAAAVSSGGLLFKAPGRVGEAAIPGAGAWCSGGGSSASVLRAASVSGVGEGVMQTMLARALCECDDDDDAHAAALRSHQPSASCPDAGAIAIAGDSTGDVSVRALFNTASFGFGLTSSADSRVRVQVARQREAECAAVLIRLR